MDTTHLIPCLVFRSMPIEIRESRILVTKQPWDVFYKRKMSVISFLERIKIYNVKLANVKWLRLVIVGFRFVRGEEVLPPSLEDANTWAVVPSCVAHPPEATKVALDDDVFCGFGILEIRVDLRPRVSGELEYRRDEAGMDMYHPESKADVEHAQAGTGHPF